MHTCRIPITIACLIILKPRLVWIVTPRLFQAEKRAEAEADKRRRAREAARKQRALAEQRKRERKAAKADAMAAYAKESAAVDTAPTKSVNGDTSPKPVKLILPKHVQSEADYYTGNPEVRAHRKT